MSEEDQFVRSEGESEMTMDQQETDEMEMGPGGNPSGGSGGDGWWGGTRFEMTGNEPVYEMEVAA